VRDESSLSLSSSLSFDKFDAIGEGRCSLSSRLVSCGEGEGEREGDGLGDEAGEGEGE
jgi:hypothetical protein